MLGNGPDGRPIIEYPGVYAFIAKPETVSRLHIGNRIIYTYTCPYGDEKELTALNFTQIKNWIQRHKVAHVKADLRAKYPRQRPQQRMQVGNTGVKKPFIWVTGGKRGYP